MTIETRLAEIRARVEAATEGPWMVNGPGEEWAAISSGPHAVIHAYTVHDGDCPGCECGDGAAEAGLTIEDAEFIAASRTDLPALLAAVEAVREKLPSLLEAAWDDGNALGLDGWTGPERGEEPDEHAIHRRARLRSKLVDEAYEAITAALEVKG